MQRHYRFKINVFFETDGKPIFKSVGGIVSHDSLFPRPDVAYRNATTFAMEEIAQTYRVAVDPREVDVDVFERVK